MDAMVNYISLVVSILAVVASFYAVMESRTKRKQDLKLQIIKEKIQHLESANETINNIPIEASNSVRQFNQIVALKQIFNKNIFFLHSQKYSNLKVRFEKIYDNYEKVSGTRLNMFSMDLAVTCALYDELDFPQELDAFYNEVKAVIQTELTNCHQELIKKSR